MVRFIDDHRDAHGIESICAVVPIAPSTYFLHKVQQQEPTTRSKRRQRADELRTAIQRVWDEHQQVYGPRKVWKQLRREGIRVARCTVERLMRDMGLRGAVRGRAWKVTTQADAAATRPADRVERRFTATRPNQLWVADFTYVATWRGFVYVAFVIDVFARRIVGWRVSASLRVDRQYQAWITAHPTSRRNGATSSTQRRRGRFTSTCGTRSSTRTSRCWMTSPIAPGTARRSTAVGATNTCRTGWVMGPISAPQLEAIRDAFRRHGVTYLFLGKTGAILHGFPDTTQDADLFLQKSLRNGDGAVRALQELGFTLTPQQMAEIRAGKDFVQLKNGPFDVDLVFAPDGINNFEGAWRRGVDIDGFPVCSIDDIIASKQASNRAKDRDTLPRLQSFRDYLRQPGRATPARLPAMPSQSSLRVFRDGEDVL